MKRLARAAKRKPRRPICTPPASACVRARQPTRARICVRVVAFVTPGRREPGAARWTHRAGSHPGRLVSVSLRPGESAISSATLSAPLRCWHPDPFHVKRPRYRGTGNLREAEGEGLGATCTAPAPARVGCPAPRPRRGPSLGSAGAIASGVKWTLATDGDQHRRGLGRVGSPVHSAAARLKPRRVSFEIRNVH